MSKPLIERLNACGYIGERIAFDDVLRDTFHAICPDWTDEELLFHPTDAQRFCNIIRAQTQSPFLPDDLILRTLVALRKNSSTGE